MSYDNTNSGALFKNERKSNDRQPDMRGSINANGVEYWVSAWRKTSKAGKPFISLALTEKDEQPTTSADDPTDLGGSTGLDGSDDFDTDIPF